MTQKQMITESELLARVSGLREKMAIIENQTEAAQEIGNVIGGAAGLAATPVRAAADAGNWLAGKAGQAWDATKQAAGAAVDATKQGVQNFATGVQQGWDATDPGKTLGYNTGGGSSAKVKWPTTPAEIKAFQQANGLTADGILGPKTSAALQAKGAKPPAGGQGAKAKPPASAQGAKAKPVAPAAAPAATNQAVDPNSQQAAMLAAQTAGMGLDQPAAAPNGAAAAMAGMGKAASNATVDTTKGPNMAQVNQGGYDPSKQDWEESVQNESVQYKSDELSRLVSLVQYR